MKKKLSLFVLALALTLAAALCVPAFGAVSVKAADRMEEKKEQTEKVEQKGENAVAKEKTEKVEISDKKLTLVVGERAVLKINGTDAKVTWKSSKKSVASVIKKNGFVKAEGKGTATITGTATIDGKKTSFTCKVTVKKIPKAKTHEIGDFRFKLPGNWECVDMTTQLRVPSGACGLKGYASSGEDFSNVLLAYQETGTGAMALSDLYDAAAIYDTDTYQALIQQQMGGMEITLEDYKVEKMMTNLGEGVVVKYTMIMPETEMKIKQNDIRISIDNYLIQIIMTDYDDGSDVKKVLDTIIDGVKLKQ